MSRRQEDEEFVGYKIIEELPRGGQATVYKAIHKATKTKVALKVLHRGPLFSDKLRRQFEREIDLVAHLDHPYIVKVHDSGIFERGYYFSMEYIHGKPLNEYVTSTGLSFRETMQLFYKVCDGIAHAHQRGVMHRDLKPSNILVDERGDPHILDFGLAKAAGTPGSTDDPAAMPSMTGEIKGTLAYMSPEQAKGRPDLVDVRTDVYSLGVVFYLIMNGVFPYDVSGSTTQILKNIESIEPSRPRNITAKFDSEVEAILLKCLAKDVTQRYHSAGGLGEDIRHWLDGSPVDAKPPSSIYLLQKIVARHRYTISVIGLLFVILIASSMVSFHFCLKARAAERKMRAIKDSWEKEAERMKGMYQIVTFDWFLLSWHRLDRKDAIYVKNFIASGSSEGKVADLLLDPNTLVNMKLDTDKLMEDDLLNEAINGFVLGEFHFKHNNQKKAIEAYEHSKTAIQKIPPGIDPVFVKGLRRKVKIRLSKLSGGNAN